MAGLVSLDPLLRATLRIWSDEAFDPVTDNCALSVLGFVERASGQALNLPRLLLHPFVQQAIAARPASFRAVARWAMARLGCEPTDAPERGDVGLVALPAAGLTACLCLGETGASRGLPMWAARLERGVVSFPAAAESAWRVPCRRR
jgi:hypothetical protein